MSRQKQSRSDDSDFDSGDVRRTVKRPAITNVIDLVDPDALPRFCLAAPTDTPSFKHVTTCPVDGLVHAAASETVPGPAAPTAADETRGRMAREERPREDTDMEQSAVGTAVTAPERRDRATQTTAFMGTSFAFRSQRSMDPVAPISLRGLSRLKNVRTRHFAGDDWIRDLDKQSDAAIHAFTTRAGRCGHYVNCDLRFFDMRLLGKVDVVHIDPPWRARGATDGCEERTMFTNCSFRLAYNTLTNEEIFDLDIGTLSDTGFIFLWVTNSQLSFGMELLSRWGYVYVDRIVWVKTAQGRVFAGQGYYILHATETCLIGTKAAPGCTLQFVPKVGADVIFAPLRAPSQKPDEVYALIDALVPGGRKVDIFARNCNVRPGWLSVGNEVGPEFEETRSPVVCSKCHTTISIGQARLKQRTRPHADLCVSCAATSGLNADTDLMLLRNDIVSMVYHHFIACDACGICPLPGVRFRCSQCAGVDLCEACVDAGRHADHPLTALEAPTAGGGYAVHRGIGCAGCSAYPILGSRFCCMQCDELSLCQKCFFAGKTPRGHTADHQIEVVSVPIGGTQIYCKCDVCGAVPEKCRFKCDNCFNFDLCERCFATSAQAPAWHAAHQPWHTFTRLIDDESSEA